MNRLFEALSEMELVRPPSRGASRQVCVIDPPVPAEEAKSHELSPETLPTDIFPTDVASVILVLEPGADQFSPESAPAGLAIPSSQPQAQPEQGLSQTVSVEATPVDMALPSPSLPAALDQIWAELAQAETTPSDTALPSPAIQTGPGQILAEAAPADAAPADTALSSPALQAELEQIMAEVALAHTAHTDMALPSPATQVEPDPILAEAPLGDTAPSNAAVPSLPIQLELLQILPAAVPADSTSGDMNLQSPAPQADQILADSVAARVSPNDASQPDQSGAHTAASWPTLEAELAKGAQPGPFKPTAGRRVNLRVRPESRLVAFTNPDSLGAEKFRALVARLEYLHKRSELTRFQVTSSVISEGKTLVSGNVAVTLAKHFGSKTLLIEGDLHRPTLATILGLDKHPGLSHWWSGRDQGLEQFVCRVEGLPLWFLPAGKPCDRPSDLLRSARFAKAFAELASQFEWVVVDSTPIVPIVDVNLWSRLVDGTLLVVREGVTPVKALRLGLQALDHPNLIGMVLNDAAAVNESKYDAQYYGSPKRKSSG